MEKEICFNCMEMMGNSLSKAEIFIMGTWVKVNCHSKCLRELSETQILKQLNTQSKPTK